MPDGPDKSMTPPPPKDSERSIGLLILSQDKTVVSMSDSLSLILGVRLDPGSSLHCSSLFHPMSDVCLGCPILRTLETGQASTGRAVPGGDREFEFDVFPEFDAEGKIFRVSVAVADLTGMRETERRLRELQDLYRAIAEDQPAIVYRYKLDGTILFGNEMLGRYSNRTMDELIGMNMFDVIEPENLEAARRQLARLSPENPVATHEHAGTGADGKIAWYQWTDRLILDDQGNPREYQGIGFNITNRKRMEENERRQRELAEALNRTGKALNSSLDLDEVLSLVLSNIHRVVPHDAAIIMMVDESHRISRLLVGENYASRAVDLAGMDGMSVDGFPLLTRILKGEPRIILDDVSQSPEWRDLPGFEWIRSFLCTSIQNEGSCIGFINLYAAEASLFSETDGERLRLFATQAALAIRNARHYEKAAWLASHDSLTGLLTRRAFFDLAVREFHRASRSEGPVSIIMIDLDHFKRVNDTYGHAAGDAALRHVSCLVGDEIRENDEAGRYGGEEIVVLLPETGVAEAIKCAERIRLALVDRPFVWGGEPVSLTGSFGVAGGMVPAFMDTRNDPLDRMLEEADKALYYAKKHGRNRVSG